MALSKSILQWISACFLLITLTKSFEDTEFLGEGLSTLYVEHSLETGVEPVFVKRGTINVWSIKSGTAQYSHEGGKVTPEDRQKIKTLVESGDFYKVRVGSKPLGSDTMQYVSAFVQACALYESKLSDVITINVDLAGNVIGVSIAAKNPVCLGYSVTDVDLATFSTSVEIVQSMPGPVPETQSYIQKIEADKAEKQKGQYQDNRSFFGKYWMYLVPLFVVLMFASGGDQGQGGR